MIEFDNIIQALQEIGAEEGSYQLCVKEHRDGTYMLLKTRDRICEMAEDQLFMVPSKERFMKRLPSLTPTGQTSFSAYDADDNGWIWELLITDFLVVSFDEE